MDILIENLYKGANCFKYSENVEEEIMLKLCDILDIEKGEITEGYNPKYDFILGNKKIELKITSKCNPNIEFARGNGDASGLLLTESDYYLILSPGGSRGEFVGKLRLFKTVDLKTEMINAIGNKDITIYEKSKLGPGSICFTLYPKNINDYWIGDCGLIKTDGKVTGFNLGSFEPAYPNFINKIKNILEK